MKQLQKVVGMTYKLKKTKQNKTKTKKTVNELMQGMIMSQVHVGTVLVERDAHNVIIIPHCLFY